MQESVTANLKGNTSALPNNKEIHVWIIRWLRNRGNENENKNDSRTSTSGNFTFSEHELFWERDFGSPERVGKLDTNSRFHGSTADFGDNSARRNRLNRHDIGE